MNDSALKMNEEGSTGYAILSSSEKDAERVMLVDAGKEVMRLVPVNTLEDIENLRLIRNECRAFMTHNTSEITQVQQLVWWQMASGQPNWRIWLTYVPGWDEPVGFAMLRFSAARWYTTLGLRTWLRGQGYGTMIYTALRELVPDGEVWAAIREDNASSIRAAIKAGYVPGEWSIIGQVAMVGRRTS